LGQFLPEKQKFIIYSDWLWKSFLCSMAAFVGIAGRFSTRKGEQGVAVIGSVHIFPFIAYSRFLGYQSSGFLCAVIQ